MLSPISLGVPVGRDFRAASEAVLAHLSDRLGFGLWMVTRTNSDDWIVLTALDESYGVVDGTVFAWGDSFCSRMVRSEGPRVAWRSADVPAYLEAPIGEQVPIGAYVGVPLTGRGGELFGTLCAIDPSPQPAEIEAELPLVEMCSELLSTILGLELDAEEARRRAEVAEALATSDELTGVANRAGWNRVLESETERCARYGHRAVLLVADLDDLKDHNDREGHQRGDELLIGLSRAMMAVSRRADTVARLGGDEFALLAVETGPDAADELVTRLRAELDRRRVSASVGAVGSAPGGDLVETWHLADQAMYADKWARRAG